MPSVLLSPRDHPAAAVALPDDWKPSGIDCGYSAVSIDNNIFFSVDYAEGKDINALTTLNASWMKENNIKLTGDPEKSKDNLNGMDAYLLLYRTTDADAPTEVTFGFVSAGKAE